jgi:hypothetical protein
METVPAPDPTSLSGNNPLILVQGQPDTSMKYSIEGRVGCLESGQYQIFDTIFEEHAREWDSIADGVAAELVRLTILPEDVLAEIWDAVSSQQASCSTWHKLTAFSGAQSYPNSAKNLRGPVRLSEQGRVLYSPG